MKRLLLALVVAGLLVGWAGATSLNFQDYGDMDYISQVPSVPYADGAGWCSQTVTPVKYWMNATNSSHLNSYVSTQARSSSGYTVVINSAPLLTTYAAATALSGNRVVLFDSSKTAIYTAAFSGVGRIEVNIVGGQAYIYKNGILVTNSTLLTTNPSYIGFGVTGWDACGWYAPSIDDFIYGDTENKYIFGGPESQKYKMVKDMITSASSGLSSVNGTVVNSNNMSSTWARGNITHLGNESIVLKNVDTGTIYGTRYTGTASYGTVSWALDDEIFNSGAPYGRYYVTIPGSGAVSEEVWYLGSGATISLDKDTYSGQDTATATYSILGAYWDTSIYSYSIDVVSGTTGATMQSTAISSSSGTEDYTFTSTDPLGVYYAIIKATKHSDGSIIWMNYDYAELTSYVTLTGYVNDAETGLPISGANVNITQNSIINNLTTIADGNYSATYYLSGAPISINATAPLHYQYLFTFTPSIAKTINLNISLTNLTPTIAGLGIGGVARETAYGRPLDGVSVFVVNTSNSQSYTTSTSMTGWYLCDEGAACFLTTERPYDVWGEKAGYSNSANATAVTA